SLAIGIYLDRTLAFKSSCPAVCQYATIVISKRQSTDEITTTGVLYAFAQIIGTLLISMMDTLENLNKKFTMELSNWVLFAIVVGGFGLLLPISPAENEGYGEDEDEQGET
ncbi:18781_t:CDS:2, partial [Racocetra persica]